MTSVNDNSSPETGIGNQVLVAKNKKNRQVTYAIGIVAMLAVIGVVVTLAVVLTRDDAVAEAIIATTEGPTYPTPIVTNSSPVSTTASPAPTQEPTQEPTPEPDPIDVGLEEVIIGAFRSQSFNGTWVSGNEILYRNDNGDLILYDVNTESPEILVANTSQILQQSFQVTYLSPDRRYVALSYNEVTIYRYSFEAQYAVIDVYTGEVAHIAPVGVTPQNASLQNFIWGPSQNAFAFVYKNNIYYQSNLSSVPEQVTTSGKELVIYNGIPDWVYEEEVFGDRNAIWFSIDGDKIAYATFDDTNVREMKIPHYGVPGSLDNQYTQHREIRYPKSGTTNPTVSVSVWNVNTKSTVTFSAPASLNEPILKYVAFNTENSTAIMWTNRVQNFLQVDICDDNTQNCATIYTYSEQNGWIDNIPLIFNEAGDSFITILPDTVNGVRYKQIVQVSQGTGALWSSLRRTNLPHTVAEILLWTANDVIWYKANSQSDISEQHIYSLSGSETSCFTCNIVRPDGGQCLYNDAKISSGSKIAIECIGPDVPQTYIYNVTGTFDSVWDANTELMQLVARRNLPITLRRTVPLGVGIPDADVLLQVPRDYISRSDIPLLVYVYAGPDTSAVTKQFRVDWGTSLVTRYGIAIARIDGRGSGLHGVDHAFTLNRQLGSVEVEDQITVARYLQQNIEFLDGNRTCIWGWSYGGYAASLALARGGDVFRCGIAVAPVVDWRFYDTIYTERYMDVPLSNTQSYVTSSLLSEQVVEAYKNKNYLLVHGTEDDNVHYQHSMLLSRMLQRQDVYFNQMSYTDEDHSLAGVWMHFYHALEKFLKENLL